METEAPKAILLKNYRPSPYLIDSVHLNIALDPTDTRVTSRMSVRPNPATEGRRGPLVLDGEGLALESVKIDGVEVTGKALAVDEHSLKLGVPTDKPFTLEITTRLQPRGQQGAVRALPVARHLLHAMRGARLPAHHLFPRPARRARTLHDAHRGRPRGGAGAFVERQPDRARRSLGSGRHYAVWKDPHPKPAYLFALVGGRTRRHRVDVQDAVGPQGRPRDLRRARQGGPLRVGHGMPQAADAVGRGALRPRIRPRRLQHRGRVRLQHGRDGEQGPQHLQRPPRARQRPKPRRMPTTRYRARRSRTNTSTTGPATASHAATGSSSA